MERRLKTDGAAGGGLLFPVTRPLTSDPAQMVPSYRMVLNVRSPEGRAAGGKAGVAETVEGRFGA
jgi:hypothetical protein